MKTRTKIFISYSHEDERWRKRVAGHLAVLAMEGIIDLCDDHKLEAGDDWLARIHEQMLSARIAVLLVSSAFLTSKFIREEEVPRLFDRHKNSGMTVYPLLVKACPWQEVSWLARMQVRPRDARPLASLRGAKVDEILVEVAREISSMAKGKGSDAERTATRAPEAGAQTSDISGEWEAEVTYDWPGATHTEVLSFKMEGDDVFGTASFLGAKRALWDGKWNGDRITFVTKSQEVCGTESHPRDTMHHYRGRILKDEIKFVMQTEGGCSEHIPIEFTARRVPADRSASTRQKPGSGSPH